MSTIVQPWQGGTGVSSVGAYGTPEIVNGVWSFAKAGRSVKYYGAKGDGSTDDSAAIQAAIDSDYPYIYFEPDGIYRLASPVTIDPITNANTSDASRTIIGNNCIILADSIVNCFQLTDGDWPSNHKDTNFSHFRFDGVCSGAYVKWTSNKSWFNEISHLKSNPTTGGATALIELSNTSTSSNPGGFTIHHCRSPKCKSTVLFKANGGGALNTFDDFTIYELVGGDYQADATCLLLESGVIVSHAHIHDILSGGPHMIYAYGAYLDRSLFERAYLEIPRTSVPLPTTSATNWVFGGTAQDCTIQNLYVYFANATDNPAVRCFYGIAYNSRILNCGMYCVDSYDPSTNPGGKPYATTYYPAIEILGGSDNIYNFPLKFKNNGTSVGGERNIYLGPQATNIQNVDNTIGQHLLWENQIFTNVGQGGAVTINLPTAKRGMRFEFVMKETGKSYTIKPAANDKIVLSSGALDDGDKIVNSNTSFGDRVIFSSFIGGYTSGDEYDFDWSVEIVKGTWADGGA